MIRRFMLGVLLAGVPGTALASNPGDAPADYTAEMKELSSIVACDGTPFDTSRFDTALIEAHCKAVSDVFSRYTRDWLDVARPFFAELVPADIPKTVVYPFGGADLLTVLSVFPDFKELTSLSLEAGGYPRGLDLVRSKRQLKKSLALHRQFLAKLVDVNHSRTLDLGRLKGDPLPSQVVFALAGLQVHGYEPVSLRYFTIGDEGRLAYLNESQASQAAEDLASAHKGSKLNRKRAELFGNFELVFKKRGKADAPLQTYRHISANLDDTHLADETKGVLLHLKSKGEVAAITKAASYLLWWRNFSTIRDYLLENLVWMVSDSTGIPANYIDDAILEQITWGRFRATAITGSPEGEAAFRELWASQPRRQLPFMFGYPSKAQHAHLVVTRRKASPSAP